MTLSLLRSARLWLVVELAVLALVLHGDGRFTLVECPDSVLYKRYAAELSASWTTRYITAGYPLILKAVGWFSPDYQAIPWVQFLGWCAAVALMDSALRRWGAAAWQALAADAGLLWAGYIMRDLMQTMLTDMPAISMAIAAMAFLLMVVATPQKIWLWVGLTLSAAFTYHIRPAYLFLLVLVPLAGLALRALRAARGQPVQPWLRFGGLLTGLTAIPFLSYCLLRLVAVGDFALVSFGGYNVIGIAVELLDRETIAKLPSQWQPLALQILQQRESSPCPRAYAQGVRRDRFELFGESYVVNITYAAMPLIRDQCGNKTVEMNRVARGLSRHVIWARKGDYLKIVAISFGCGLENSCQGYTGKWIPAPKLRARIVQFLLAVLLIFIVRKALEKRWGMLAAGRREWHNDHGATQALATLGLLFLLLKLGLVVAVETPITRYTFPAFVFVSATVVLWAGRELACLFSWLVDLDTAMVRLRQLLKAIAGDDNAPLGTQLEELAKEVGRPQALGIERSTFTCEPPANDGDWSSAHDRLSQAGFVCCQERYSGTQQGHHHRSLPSAPQVDVHGQDTRRTA